MKELKMVTKGLIVAFLIVPIFFLLFSGTASAQQWAKTYGGSSWGFANSVQQTSDGGYVMAGDTESFGAGSWDAWVLKLNDKGNVQWQKTYGGRGWDYANSIQQTADGGYIVAGWTSSFGAGGSDAWVLKLDGNGIVQWQKTYGGIGYDYVYSIQQTLDGGYVLAGETPSSRTRGSDAWVLKLDGNGNVQWQKTYGGALYDHASSIRQTSDGGYVMAGDSESSGTRGSDAWVLKLNGNGNVQWLKTYGGISWDYANSIQQTADGGYIVAGWTSSSGAGGSDAWVLKLDGTGNVQWQKTYGGIGYNYVYSIQQTLDGGYVLAGETPSSGAGGSDAWVLKLDGNGNVQWQKTYGGALYDHASSIEQTSDGGYIMAGRTMSFAIDGCDAWALKLDDNGNVYDCSIMRTANAQVIDTNATMQAANVTGIDAIVSLQTSTASVSNTNAVVKELCLYGCNLIPDAAVIPRGGTLAFKATITNHTNGSETVLFATKATLPNGNEYPPSGYLMGPMKVTLNPYESQFIYESHMIPVNAPSGTYTYHGYICNYGVCMYDGCHFDFTVTQ